MDEMEKFFNFINLAPDSGGGSGSGSGSGGDVIVDDPIANALSGGELEDEPLFLVDGIDEIPDDALEEDPIPEDVKKLQEEKEALQRQMEELRKQADATMALQQGISELGQTLRPQTQPQPQPQQPQAPKDPLLEKDNFNEKFLEDPYGMLEKFQMQKLAPEFQRIMQTNVSYAKQFLMLDPEKSKVYEKYAPEVEEVVKSFPPVKQFTDPNVYKEAADIVASRHFSETLEEMKAQMREELLRELKGESGNPPETRPPIHSETGTGTGTRRRGKANILPKAVWEAAGQRGLQGRGDKDDKARVYEMWKSGSLRVPGHEFGK